MKALCWIILGAILLGANVFAIYRVVTDNEYHDHGFSLFFLCEEGIVLGFILLGWIMNILTGGS